MGHTVPLKVGKGSAIHTIHPARTQRAALRRPSSTRRSAPARHALCMHLSSPSLTFLRRTSRVPAPGAVSCLVGAMGTDNKVLPEHLADEISLGMVREAAHQHERESLATDPPEAQLSRGSSFKALPKADVPEDKKNHDDHEMEVPKGTQTFYAHGKEFRFAKR